MRAITAMVISMTFVLTASAGAQNLAISDDQHFLVPPGVPKPGEVQSAVVAPGLKTQCLAGRLLTTNDWQRPPRHGVVGRDLNAHGSPDIIAKFGEVPGLTPLRRAGSFSGFENPASDPRLYPRYLLGTNDHDLVSLSNGDVLYITGAFSRAFIKVPWFEHSFRGTFGPGARSVVLTWRSTDCGETFKFAGEFDPARMEDGSCAMPQFRMDANNKIIPGLPYDMGGSDGQLVRVAPSNDRLYLTFQCVGYNPLTTTPKFTLNARSPLDKTLVAYSDDGGVIWKSLGFIDTRAWRFPVVPVGPGKLAFAFRDGVLFGSQNPAHPTGKYDFSDFKAPEPRVFGWSAFPFTWGKAGDPYIWANIWGHTLAARTPGSNNFFIVSTTTVAGKGFGYRISFYDQSKQQFADADDENDVLPSKPGKTNFVFHLTAIDTGKGPVLLYWYDIDGDTRAVTIRGRFVLGQGVTSTDFVISNNAGVPRSFALNKIGPPGDWFGDYLTAGGFQRSGPLATNVYYPVWVEPGGIVHFASVQYNERGSGPSLVLRKLPPPRWTYGQAAVRLSTLPPTETRVESRESH